MDLHLSPSLCLLLIPIFILLTFTALIRTKWKKTKQDTEPEEQPNNAASNKKSRRRLKRSRRGSNVRRAKEELPTKKQDILQQPREEAAVISAPRTFSTTSVRTTHSFSTVSVNSTDPNSPRNRILDLSELLPEVKVDLRKERRKVSPVRKPEEDLPVNIDLSFLDA